MSPFPMPHVRRPDYGPLDPGTRDGIGDRVTLSVTQAGDLVGVSRRTIYNWLESGKVEYVRHAGGAVRIFADTLFRPAESRA